MSHEAADLNDALFDERLHFINAVLSSVLNFEVAPQAHLPSPYQTSEEADTPVQPVAIKPIAYDEDFPFPYNKFVNAVDVDLEASQPEICTIRRQPGTHDVPHGLSVFVIRLANPVSGCNDTVRVENEVAALSLARDALGSELSHLVHRVFGWGSAKDRQGWIL